MKLFIAILGTVLIVILGMVLVVAWAIERRYVRRAEGERRRDRELSYLAGTKRWWQEPPGTGRGDH